MTLFWYPDSLTRYRHNASAQIAMAPWAASTGRGSEPGYQNTASPNYYLGGTTSGEPHTRNTTVGAWVATIPWAP